MFSFKMPVWTMSLLAVSQLLAAALALGSGEPVAAAVCFVGFSLVALPILSAGAYNAWITHQAAEWEKENEDIIEAPKGVRLDLVPPAQEPDLGPL